MPVGRFGWRLLPQCGELHHQLRSHVLRSDVLADCSPDVVRPDYSPDGPDYSPDVVRPDVFRGMSGGLHAYGFEASYLVRRDAALRRRECRPLFGVRS